ncbi:MAG: FAD-binding protein, partial [Actinobacteria bacterium]|nr:FAD-binding protein [Actinomycetota bacterium]
MSADYDLLVVGCGGAGLSAAVTYIQEAGPDARVAVLERSKPEDRGGSTRWTTAGMRVNEEFVLDPNWVGRVQEVSKNLADLEYCLVFEAALPELGTFLRASGIEFLTNTRSMNGVVRTTLRPNGGGLAIVDALARLVEAAPNAAIHYETEAVRLSLNDEGRVDGVDVRGPDGLLKTYHAQSVVLACGGFEGNYEMLTQYVGQNAVDLKILAPGTQYNKGDGIRMATEIGAATSGQFDGIHAELVDIRTDRADAVLYGHTYTVAVNGDAKRFYDEGAKDIGESFELIAYDVWANQEQTAFLLTDELIMSREELTARFDTDIPPAKADSIRDLALQLGLDPDALEQTVNEYNAAVNDNDFDPWRFDGKATVGIEPPKS